MRWILVISAGVASTLGIGFGAATPAAAQSTPNVIVDLSVLNTPGGYAPYPPPAYGVQQPYGQAAQPYGTPQPYGQAVPRYGVPQPYGQGAPVYGGQSPYGQPAQPYGGQLPYGQPAQPYGGQQANAGSLPAYGGYLVMPNTGYGPPQATILAPPTAFARVPAPPTVTAQQPRRNAPIQITADPPVPAPVTASEVIAQRDSGAAPAMASSVAGAAKPQPEAAPAATAAATAAIVRSTPKPAPVSVRIAAAPAPATKAAPIMATTPAAPTTAIASSPTATAAPVVVSPAPAVAAPVPTAAAVSPASPTTEKAQVAARAPASGSDGGAGLAIPFDSDSAELEDSTFSDLDTIAAKLTDDDALRVRLVAYAEGDDEEASKARRLSLSRALAVRGYLIKQGIRSTRMDVRALGNKVEGGPSDRVDVMVVTR